MSDKRYVIYPAMSRKAVADGCYKVGLRHWYVLADMGVFDKPIEVKEAIRHLTKVFGSHRSHLYRLFKKYDGKFFSYMPSEVPNKETSYIVIYSPKRVAEALGMRVPGRQEECAEYELLDNTNMYPYRLMLREITKHGVPIARESMAQLMKISQRSQQYYDKRLNHKRYPNFEAVAEFETVEEMNDFFNDACSEGRFRPGRERRMVIPISTANGVVKIIGIFRRIANVYDWAVRAKNTAIRSLFGTNGNVGFYFSKLSAMLRVGIHITTARSCIEGYTLIPDTCGFDY